jgi:DNA-binding beta-propeller fold protein YncE
MHEASRKSTYMLNRGFSLCPILLGASLFAVSGCGTQPLGPVSSDGLVRPAGVSRDAKTGVYVYTCQSASSSVDCLVYAKNKVLRTLTKSLQKPLGVAAGKDGRFYVADKTAMKIFVYSAGGTKQIATLNDAGNVPLDVAVDADKVAVANQTTLTFFAKGATKPTATLKDTRVSQGYGAAFDTAGNCYWSFASKTSGARVDEFKGCKGNAHDLEIGAGSPYGIAFDGSNNLYYTSYLSASDGVYKCIGITSCALAYGKFVDPQYLNFSRGFTDLWVSDPGNYQSGAALYKIDAATGKVLVKITDGISFFDPPTGVAAGPGPL